MRMSEKDVAISGLAGPEKARNARQSRLFGAHGTPFTRWFLVGGLLLFALLLLRTRLDTVAQILWNASWSFPLVFIPYTLVIVCETLGWWFAFPSTHSIHLIELLRLTVAAKAVQFLTPSLIQAGEFMKIHLLKESGVRADLAAASVVVAKTTIMIAELLFIGLGLSFTLGHVAVEPIVVSSVMLGITLMALCMMGAVLWQRAGLFRPFVWAGRHLVFLTPFLDRYEGFLSSTERIVQAHLGEKRRFAWSCSWFFTGWAAGIVEVWVFLTILGLPSDVASAVFIQVWSLIVTRLTSFIPANLGAQEAGFAVTFSLLELSAESSMAFAVLRRLRQLGWIAASLGCLRKLSRE